MAATPTLTRSPLALPFPAMPAIDGVTLRTARARYKDWDRADLTLVELVEGTCVAGVFTNSACASPEVEAGREQLTGGKVGGAASGAAHALVVNAGNSNAFTGAKGRAAVDAIQSRVADTLGCDAKQVFVSSTGVIGVPLPIERAEAGLTAAFASEPCGWEAAAAAIGTTDTFAKGAHASAMIGDQRVEMAGIVKGSGMIAPDMATMLGYVFTDANVAPQFLQELLERANETTFNCITVDGDTSTSDTVLAFATGTAANPRIEDWASPGADALAAAITDVARQLAQAIVRDGEGAAKFITVRVSGAAGDESARRIALAIANSPLVKTAIAGEDANWGRVVMAVGKAGEPADRDRLSIAFGGIQVAREGCAVAGYDEAPVARHLQGENVDLTVDLGIGDGRATVWTCDLTYGYIAINADYRS